MAKQAKEIKKFEFSKIGTILENISKTVSIQIDKELKKKTYISTGSYMLNAALSGSLYGGIGTSGISVFGGPEASGKTYLALNIMREAQKAGYGIVYIDTENAINRLELTKYGLDNSPEKFIIVRGNQVEDLNITLTTLVSDLKQAKLDGYELPKQIWALDSLGQLSSKKMKEDLLKGDIKAEVGNKAKAIGSMFVSITQDISYLEIPMVVNNQTYETMEMFSQTVMKGGRQLYYSANNITFLTKAKLKEDGDEMDITGGTGIIVTAKCIKNRAVKPKQIKLEISFENGMNPYKYLEMFCHPKFFDTVGIAQGKMEVDKSTGEIKFIPGSSSARWYVKHLDRSFTKTQLHNSTVFNKDVLNALEPIVNSYFQYKSVDEMQQMEKELEALNSVDDDQFGDVNIDEMDADSLFS